MDVLAYLDRIGFAGETRPDLDTLAALQRAHLYSVPFENLDIHLGVPIELDLARIEDKVVGRRRGGFCYELNGLFSALLREVGFEVALLSCRVLDDDGRAGPEFDHLALSVRAGGTGYLVDVGFGEGPRAPIEMRPGAGHAEVGLAHLLEEVDGSTRLLQRDGDGKLTAGYALGPVPRRLEEFAAMCRHHQTSSESPFTRKRVCSLATPTGRVSLSETTLIETDCGARRESQLAGEEECRRVLRERFGIAIERYGAISGAATRSPPRPATARRSSRSR